MGRVRGRVASVRPIGATFQRYDSDRGGREAVSGPALALPRGACRSP